MFPDEMLMKTYHLHIMQIHHISQCERTRNGNGTSRMEKIRLLPSQRTMWKTRHILYIGDDDAGARQSPSFNSLHANPKVHFHWSVCPSLPSTSAEREVKETEGQKERAGQKIKFEQIFSPFFLFCIGEMIKRRRYERYFDKSNWELAQQAAKINFYHRPFHSILPILNSFAYYIILFGK